MCEKYVTSSECTKYLGKSTEFAWVCPRSCTHRHRDGKRLGDFGGLHPARSCCVLVHRPQRGPHSCTFRISYTDLCISLKDPASAEYSTRVQRNKYEQAQSLLTRIQELHDASLRPLCDRDRARGRGRGPCPVARMPRPTPARSSGSLFRPRRAAATTQGLASSRASCRSAGSRR